MSDLGGGTGVTGLNIVYDDAAASLPPATLVSGTFRPSNIATGDTFVAPGPTSFQSAAPAGTATFASAFAGATANGNWNLFIMDDAAGDSMSMTGWKLTLTTQQFVCNPTAPTNSRADFDGDGRTDVGVFRNGQWYIQRSTAGFVGVNWGQAGDVTVPGDFDGDNRADFAVYRPTATVGIADFIVLNSATSTVTGVEWGTTGDIARIGDFTGDNRDDFCVYRPSTNIWYILPSSGASPLIYSIGPSGGTPIVLYWDANAIADVAVVNNGHWYIRQSGSGTQQFIQWGQAGDRYVAADYDNDNREDTAVFRNGIWYVLTATFNVLPPIYFGTTGDVPVPGDYDGDGDDDAAVFRPSNSTWYINNSGIQIFPFGTTGDIPTPSNWAP